jgi:hypothetical protein
MSKSEGQSQQGGVEVTYMHTVGLKAEVSSRNPRPKVAANRVRTEQRSAAVYVGSKRYKVEQVLLWRCYCCRAIIILETGRARAGCH